MPFFLRIIFGSVVLVVLLFIDRVRRNCHPCVIRKILIILRAENKNQKKLLPTTDRSRLLLPRAVGVGRQGKQCRLYGVKSLS